MASRTTSELAGDVVQQFCVELGRVVDHSLPSGLSVEFRVPCEVYLSAEIPIQVKLSSGLPWLDFVSAFDDAASQSDMIHGYWTTKANDELCVLMALDVWRSTRLDRLVGSRILNMVNNDALDSPKRMQALKLTSSSLSVFNFTRVSKLTRISKLTSVVNHADSVLPVLAKHLRRWESFVGPDHIQEILRYAESEAIRDLRQSAIDLDHEEETTRVAECDAVASAENLLLPAAVTDLGQPQGMPRSAEQSLLRSSVAALRHAISNGCHEKLPHALSGPQVLMELSKTHAVSAAERSLTETPARITMVHFRGKAAAEAHRQRQPSFFVAWLLKLRCQPQVHVIDLPICAKRFCHLVSFTQQPADSDLAATIEVLRQVLDLRQAVRVVIIEPVKASQEPWFRADGDLHVRAENQILARFKGVAFHTPLGPNRPEPALPWKELVSAFVYAVRRTNLVHSHWESEPRRRLGSLSLDEL